MGAAAVVLLLAACGPAEPPEQVAGSTCVGSTNAAGLTNLFDQIPGGMFAADYQRAVPLPDGRTLWLFQDASITLPPPPPPPEPPPLPLPGTPPPPPVVPATRLVHNAALLQTGTCFDLLRSGTDDAPGPWLFPAETAPFSHWFWPLDATVGQDGRLYVFVAEMVERGPLYLSTTEPIATRVVAVDLATMTPVAAGLAPNASAVALRLLDHERRDVDVPVLAVPPPVRLVPVDPPAGARPVVFGQRDRRAGPEGPGPPVAELLGRRRPGNRTRREPNR